MITLRQMNSLLKAWLTSKVAAPTHLCEAPYNKNACPVSRSKIETLTKSAEASNSALQMEKEKLLRSNRDLEIFAAAAAHDLKSPLQSSLSWLKILRESLLTGDQLSVDQAVRIIDRNIETSILFINDLLTISRLNSDPTPHVRCDFVAMMDHLLCIHTDEISAARAVIRIGTLPDIMGNATQLELVFSNLIRNALQYRDPKRHIEIQIGALDLGDSHEFYVKDSGMGIPQENLQDIFRLYQRLQNDHDRPGTGMGLAYCQKAIHLHGGRIWAESQVGKGTTFRFRIPKPPRLSTPRERPLQLLHAGPPKLRLVNSI